MDGHVVRKMSRRGKIHVASAAVSDSDSHDHGDVEDADRGKSSYGHYVSTQKGDWYLKLEYMEFVFEGGVGKIASEKEEGYINRFVRTLNALQPPQIRTVTRQEDEYKVWFRWMAMKHLLNCLEQGEINEQFKRQQRILGLLSDTSDTSSSSDTSTQQYIQTGEIGPLLCKLDVTDVKWKVGGQTVILGETFDSFVSAPIDPNYSPLLHSAIQCLTPKEPSELFFVFGIAVYCAELQDILAKINPGNPFNDVKLIHQAAEAISFLTSIHNEWLDVQPAGYTNRRKPVVVEIIYSIRHMKESKKALSKKWTEILKPEFSAGNLCASLNAYSQVITEENEDEFSGEVQLQNLVCNILRLDGVPIPKFQQGLKQFQKKVKAKMSTYTPDILWMAVPDSAQQRFQIPLILEIKKCAWKSMQMCGGKISESFRPEFVWYVFEQLLSALLSKLYDVVTEEEHVVQGCLMVVDHEVRSAILHMRSDVYRRLKECSNLNETLMFLRDYAEPHWCSIYLERSAHPIWSVTERAKITFYNFTENWS